MFLSWEYFFSNAVITSVFVVFVCIALVVLALVTALLCICCRIRTPRSPGSQYTSVNTPGVWQ
jgi:hypothetical protein